jgi:hypothetical protein
LIFKGGGSPLRLDKEAIKSSLTEKDIENILIDLGSGNPKPDTQGNLIFTTVCHGGHKHKLYYYHDSKTFHCYTDCSETMDIYEVVIRAKKKKGIIFSFYDAVRYVSTLTGKVYTSSSVFDKINTHIIDDWEWINRLKRNEKPKIELPVYDETVMNVFLKYPNVWWEEEGISLETQQQFEICYYPKEDRIVIPHRNMNGELVGIRGRAMRQEDIDAGKKYMPLTIEGKLYSHPTLYNLYGLHKTKEAIRRHKKALLLEGEKSVLKTEQYYGDDNFSVATCSSNISDWHIKTLLDLGVEEIFIGFDRQYENPDSEEAYRYAEKLKKFAYKIAPYATVYVLWDNEYRLKYKDSPCDQGKEILEQLMKEKYEIKTKEVLE